MSKDFKFQREDNGTLTLASAVFQALGAASTCWTENPTGVFNSEEAKEIGDSLIKAIIENKLDDIEILSYDDPD